jgi:hypothetical protein
MRIRATPEKREEVLRDVARRRAVKGYPPIEEFIHAYVEERNGNTAPMQKFLADCRAAKRKRGDKT